ncbi:MAG: sigma-54-dependent Fis family transcriptional regulator [Comamonas sp. SCN 65-56]|uniref:sigma-54-dependent Fis family transcriptional regulator n=1 Tax=Comamonas sp. SCN 65-56 TaxID=1660095 RepID=UPI00086C00ED|nr:sigma-54-dependent Fis family transcriptional regulator [Comamonas sp. SCN 65-56]ODS91053.1 MAG: sigma-54-dependent Fis family transcriptional regulator [Comamonas sp. SCN 65-56]
MKPFQQAHIETVLQVAERGVNAPGVQHDRLIRESWLRCVTEHGLEPTRMQEAIIVSQQRLREHQEQMEALLQIARHGLESLYGQMAGLGYCVLLTDARGVTVDFLGDLQIEPGLRKAGLYLGADWSEAVAGTCGVGTCISTGQALTVHLNDHFDACHIPLTCTTAPVFDSQGQLRAVLDVSQLSSSQPKSSQHLALQLVQRVANDIEDATFLQRHRRDWVLRLSGAPQFLDVQPEYLLALDMSGRVVGHNQRAHRALGDACAGGLLGASFESLFGQPLAQIGRFVAAEPSDRRAVMFAGGPRLLFLSATPPVQARALAPAQLEQAAIPAPLAQLSAGDAALQQQIARAARLLNSPINLLITGETGSGKEYFAKAVHESSERRVRPFVAVNCAAIPEALIESELFGYVGGSFSGASAKGKRGLIAEAEGGTLFLDEIGDMPLTLQTRLLRVLSEREMLPVGATRPVAINVRVIAATHAALEQRVREGRFRDDLYYRLNGAHIQLPPLRERSDLLALIERWAAGRRFSPAAQELLLHYPWPGNLRQLRNALEYAIHVCPEGDMDVGDLPDWLVCAPVQPQVVEAPPQRTAAAKPSEPDWLQVLQDQGWNVSAAARQLGLSRMTLYRRMQRAGLPLPQRGQAAVTPE